ncbi:chromosome partitioning protein ParB [Sphingomonas histidinilytica]|uniref:ParB/RepB/Spo0J family partition protein n=1 Tax=Rhizorhabdus histidinilytica TaxID=439228 RepID=UPI001AD971B4|nr:ParB/Srx family N-terminal domain-containing protein [Rhizorhabdus histidinilytica]MBO9375561.1 chromosome partitioning protein ParB [Rhizorhabdus histidinilytica]
MNYPIVYVPARNCVVSPLNVRTQSDPEADAELEALIGETGYVIQNLIGVAVKRKKDSYSIFGGGRRLTRVLSLIEKGKLHEDFEVPVMVLPNTKDAITLSLAENQKLPTSPADECMAYKNMIEKEGKTPAQVAARFHKSERFVLGRVRLADLAEVVFEALRKGEITLEIAMAYGSNPDVTRQAAVFEEMSQGYYSTNASEIRRRLAQGTYLGGDPKALLVGREAYVAAGGRIDPDLFSNEATERWIDGDLVDRLANEKLAEAAEAIREREGFAEIRVLPTTHVTYQETYDLRPVRAELPPLAPEQEARCEEIQAELETIEERASDEDGEGYTEDDEARTRELEAEYQAIVERTPVLTDEQKATALAYVVIGRDGQPRIHEQLYVAPAAVDDEESEPSEVDGEDETVEDQASGKPVISQRLADELATMKAELLRLHVASDPRFALDLGTFYMADKARQRYGGGDLATELRSDEAPSRVIGFQSDTRAAEEWAKLDAALDRSWTDHVDVRDRYDAFCTLPEEARAAWLGWAIARTIHAVPAGKTGSAFIDHLGQKLEIDVASWWRPTAKNYFDRISKASILAQFEDVGGAELRQRYGASKKHDLAASAERLFAGDMHIGADDKARALAWVPEAMRFETIAPQAANDAEPSDDGLADVTVCEAEPQDDAPIANAA